MKRCSIIQITVYSIICVIISLFPTRAVSSEKSSHESDYTFSGKESLTRYNRTYDMHMIAERESMCIYMTSHEPVRFHASALVCSGAETASHVLPLSEHPEEDGDVIRYHRGKVTEWYKRVAGGIEQGFTLHEGGNACTQTVFITCESDLALYSNTRGDGVVFCDTKGAEVYHYAGIRAWDATGRDIPVHVSCKEDTVLLSVVTKEAHFPVTIDPIITSSETKIISSDGASWDQFGKSVSIDGDVVAVGVPSDEEEGISVGSVYIYYRTTKNYERWIEVTKKTLFSGSDNDRFGASVSLDGDVLVVGVPGVNGERGTAYVYQRNEGGIDQWGQIAQLSPIMSAEDDGFGSSVVIDGDVIAVGAPGKDNYQGATYIYHRSYESSTPPGVRGGTRTWEQVCRITAMDGAEYDEFGGAVSLYGDVLVVGARFDEGGEGAAYVFNRSYGGGDNWGEVTKLTASDANSEYQFGGSVSVDGDVIVVGADANTEGMAYSGFAYVFHRDYGGARNWGEVKKLIPSNGSGNDTFGVSVCVNADIVVVGASATDAKGWNSGSGYIYQRNYGGADNWGEVNILSSSDISSDDYFGSAVCIEGNTAVIGAPGNAQKGAAYIFPIERDRWDDHIKVHAPDGVANDTFGCAVATDGDILVAGAQNDDDNGMNSGSVSVYYRTTGSINGWGFVTKITAPDGQSGDWFGGRVALDGDILAVGACGDDDNGGGSGAVYIFQRDKGGIDTWGYVAKITASDGTNGDNFGCCCDIYNDVLVVGANQEDGAGMNRGAVYIFQRNEGDVDLWSEVTKIAAFDSADDDWFGTDVSVLGNVLVIGAKNDDDCGANSGSAYIYSRDAGGINNWGYVKKLTASDGMAYDYYGSSVSGDGDMIAIGAPHPAVLATGKGSVYMYNRNAGGTDNWGEVSFVSPPDTANGDAFGCSVQLCGDILIAGAYGDDDAGSSSGSAYVYQRSQYGYNNWGLVQKVVPSDGVANAYFGASLSHGGDACVIGAYGDDDNGASSGSVYMYNPISLPGTLYMKIINTESGVVIEETCDITGTNNAAVVGYMWLTNQCTGTRYVTNATLQWGFTDIPLDVGENEITVLGTNEYGITVYDAIVLTRIDATPYVAITTTPAWVTYDRLTYTIAGTNNTYIVGGMRWTNYATSAHGTYASSPGWRIEGIGLATGTNTIAVYGTNMFGAVTNDYVTIVRGVAGTGVPRLNITSATAHVAYDITSYKIAGTNNANVVGVLCWSNTLTHFCGTLPATPSWHIDSIDLGEGNNLITVSGTNMFGAACTDSVVITRYAPLAYVAFTSETTWVSYDTSRCSLYGTNSLYTVGMMSWSNTLLGVCGILPATPSWHIDSVFLGVGDNVYTLYGTNKNGLIAHDSVTVTRGAPGTGVPFLSITTQPCWVEYTVSTYTIAGTNNANVVGVMEWSNTHTHAHGTLPAADSWSITSIPLAVGDNTLIIYGTNVFSVETTHSVTITRGPEGTGIPHVTITTPPAIVSRYITTYDITGTNNAHVVGMYWHNNCTGDSGDETASTSWTISSVALGEGANTITVTGTNIFGMESHDSVTVTRDATAPPAPDTLYFECGHSNVHLYWDAPSDPSGDIAGYSLYRDAIWCGTNLPPSTTNFTFTGLLPHTGYWIRVATFDAYGNTNNGTAVLGVTLLDNPWPLDVVPYHEELDVAWTQVSPSGYVQSYAVYAQSSPFTNCAGMEPYCIITETNTTIAGLANDVTTYVAVTTINISAGEDTAVTNTFGIPRHDYTGPALTNLCYDGISVINGFTNTYPRAISIHAEDRQRVNRVEFYVDGSLIGCDTDSGPEYSMIWDITQISDGLHTLVIRAYDSLENMTEQTWDVYVLLSPPPESPVITAPVNGSVTADEIIEVSGTVDMFSSSVQLYTNGIALGTPVPVVIEGTFEKIVTLSDGVISLSAAALNRAGEGPQATISVTVDTSVPQPPSGVTADSLPGGIVRLSWWNVPQDRIAGCHIYRSTDPFSNTVDATCLTASPVIEERYDDVPSTNGVYYYRLTTVNAAGTESALSAEVEGECDGSGPQAMVTLDSTGPVSSNRYGAGVVTMTLTVDEPLVSAPFVSIAQNNVSPVPVDMLPAGELTYTGVFEITSSYQTGPAYVLFSARDEVGNPGTTVTAGDVFEIDVKGPAVTVTVTPASPIQNSAGNPVTITAALDFVATDVPVATPTFAYTLSTTQTNPVNIPLQSSGATSWEGIFTLSSSAGLPAEMMRFTYSGVDSFGNPGSRVYGDTAVQVYQGTLPPLEPPSPVKAKALPGGMVSLWWPAVSNAADYCVSRRSPGEGVLTAFTCTGGATNYTDTPVEGTNAYAIASVRNANGQVTTGAYGDVVSVRADATPPSAPASPWLVLVQQGMLLGWTPGSGSDDTVGYNVYRDVQPLSVVTGMTPIVADTPLTNALDTAPLRGDAYYAITAIDAAGNISALSPSVSTNTALTPVNTFAVHGRADDNPVVCWQHTYSNYIDGFNVYVGDGATEVKIPLGSATSSYVDPTLPLTNRTYSITARTGSGATESESIRRSVVLPVVDVEVSAGQEFTRGIMNQLYYLVSNRSGIAYSNAVLSVLLNGVEHTSSQFILGGAESVRVPVVIPGYTNGIGTVVLSNQLIMTTATGEQAIWHTESTVPTRDDVLQMDILNEQFMQGAVCTARVSVVNTSPVTIEIITAKNNGKDISPDVRMLMGDEDANVLSVGFLTQALGEDVILLSDGTSVARIEPGEEFISGPIAISVPATAPDNARLRGEVDTIHYRYGKKNHVAMPGGVTTRDISLDPPPYTARVLGVDPRESLGDVPVTITGITVAAESSVALGYVPVSIIIEHEGFERSFTTYTDENGVWSYAYTVPENESGTYRVYATYPAVSDRTVQDEFSVNRISVSPSSAKITIPRNYAHELSFDVSICKGVTLTNLQLAYVAADQDGGVLAQDVTVTCSPTVAVAAAESTYRFTATITAGDTAPLNPTITLRVASDGPAPGVWNTIDIDCTFLETNAVPLLVATPSVVETGVAVSNRTTEEILIENTGFQSVVNAKALITDTQGNAAPDWVLLNNSSDLGMIDIGDMCAVSISFSPDASVPVSGATPYEFYVHITGDNYATCSVPVYVYVDNSGLGKAFFRVVDIYTGTLDQESNIIRGVEGARVKLIKESGSLFLTNVVTDVNGEVFMQGLPVGMYNVRISAAQHKDYSDHLWIKPGTTVTREFPLPYELITFEWSVDETTILDQYNIILNIVFETDVPAAVMVFDPPSMNLPDMEVGDVLCGEITLKNYGLIQAENVWAEFPDQNEYFRYEFVDTIPEIVPAHGEVTVPYRITCLKEFGTAQQSGGAEGDCIRCLECVIVYYDFECENGDTYTETARHCTITSSDGCRDADEGGSGIILPGDGGGDGGGGWIADNDNRKKCWIVNRRQEEIFKKCINQTKFNNISEKVGCSVDMQRGEYRDDLVDLVVKAPGKTIKVIRRFYDQEWHWEPTRSSLQFNSFFGIDGAFDFAPSSRGDSTGGGAEMMMANYITKDGVKYDMIYEKDGMEVYAHSNYRIFKTMTGYRWTSPDDFWKIYDKEGNILSEGTHALTTKRFLYDTNGMMTGIADMHTNQLVWFEYTNEGEISAVEDAHNHRMEYLYDGQGKLTNVTDVAGRNAAYTYDSEGRIIQARDLGGRIVNITYNDDDRVKSVMDADGVGKTFVYDYNESTHEWYVRTRKTSGEVKEVWYDSNGQTRRVDVNGETIQTISYDENTTYITDYAGRVTRKEYDDNGNVTRIIYPDGTFVQYAYHPEFKSPTKHINQKGIVTEMEYDEKGRLIHRIDAKGKDIERHFYTKYNEAGFVRMTTWSNKDGSDAMTNHFYQDYYGNLTNHIDGEGYMTKATAFDSVGNVMCMENPEGAVWEYGYDNLFRRVTTTNPLGKVTHMYYNNMNNVTALYHNTHMQMWAKYDERDRVIESVNSEGITNSMFYDDKGRLTKQTIGNTKSVTLQYDQQNRLTSTSDNRGNSKEYNYNSIDDNNPDKISINGNIVYTVKDIMDRTIQKTICSQQYTNKIQTIYDELGYITMEIINNTKTNHYVYDALNRLVRTISYDGYVVTRTHDYRDNITSVTDENGTIHMSYDKCNNLTNIIYQNNTSISYGYTPMRRLAWQIDEYGRKTEYDYDILGRLICTRIYANDNYITPGKTIDYQYDEWHNVVWCSDGITSISNVYDRYQRKLAEIVDYGPFSLTYSNTYNAFGMRTSFTGADGIKIGYSYDEQNRLQRIGIPGAGIMTLGDYDTFIGSHTFPGGVKRTYTYDDKDRLNSILDNDGNENEVLSHIYNFDDNLLLQKKKTEHGDYSYQYSDENMYLTHITNASGLIESYAYDSVGNWTNSYYADTWVYGDDNQLISNDTVELSYDMYGNVTMIVTEASVKYMEYDIQGHMTRVKDDSDSVIAEYGYDMLGRRLWKIANTTTTYYHYSDQGLVGEYNASGQPIKTYGYYPVSRWTSNPLYVKVGSHYYWYCNDWMGTPQKLIDSSGKVVWEGRYDAFGNCTTVCNTVTSNLRFPGQYFDEETGLYYNWQRYYHPGLGRYMSIDPAREGNNYYIYAGANPVMFCDPTGLHFFDDPVNYLEALGVVDPTPICDGICGIIYASRGEWGSALLSCVAMVPYIGDVLGKGGKVFVKFGDDLTELLVRKYGDEVVDIISKYGDEALGPLVRKYGDEVIETVGSYFDAVRKRADDLFDVLKRNGVGIERDPVTGKITNLVDRKKELMELHRQVDRLSPSFLFSELKCSNTTT